MFFEAHRLSIFTPRSLDVDVVLDLMIHDLDIVLTFAKSEVREVRAVGLPILSPKVDIANVRVEFESGCVANFTASRVSTERVRKLRFFEPRQYVSIDYARQDLLVIRIDAEPGGTRNPLALLPPHIAAMIPPQIASGLAADLVAGKIDPAIIAKYASSMNIDPALVAQFTAPTGPAPGLSFVKPTVTTGSRCGWRLSRFSIQPGLVSSRALLRARAAMHWHLRWRFNPPWPLMPTALGLMTSSKLARKTASSIATAWLPQRFKSFPSLKSAGMDATRAADTPTTNSAAFQPETYPSLTASATNRVSTGRFRNTAVTTPGT